jgi:hypothetical protein
LHGWVYDLKEVAEMPPGTKIEDIQEFEFDRG